LDADFGNGAFHEGYGADGGGGNTLKNAYLTASQKAGTYTRPASGWTWSKQP